jgi:hypothetical protein
MFPSQGHHSLQFPSQTPHSLPPHRKCELWMSSKLLIHNREPIHHLQTDCQYVPGTIASITLAHPYYVS